MQRYDEEAEATDRYIAAFPEIADLWDSARCCWVVHDVADGWQVLVTPLMFTAAVLVSRPTGLAYADRWCYPSVRDAIAAARAWRGPYPGSEPIGWHRHPATGRRRANGDPSRETVAM